MSKKDYIEQFNVANLFFIKLQTFLMTTYLDRGYKLYKSGICALTSVNIKYILTLVVLFLYPCI